MSDRTKAGFGLAVFFVLGAFPFWQRFGTATEIPVPDLELPAEATSCVEDTDYMRANHMDLLNGWRNQVVREGGREYTAASGEVFTVSLTGTCLDCHSNTEAFCTRCHDFADVQPACWDCHIQPGGD